MADQTFNNVLGEAPYKSRDATYPSQTWIDHQRTGAQSYNMEYRTGGSPDERDQRWQDLLAWDDNRILDALRQEAKNNLNPPPPMPRPRMSPEGWQQINEAVSVSKYMGDMATWDYTHAGGNIWTTGGKSLQDKAHSAKFNFETVGKFLTDNSAQYRVSAEFLLDSFKRARTVGLPISTLSPVLHGLPSAAFEGQAK